MEVFMKKKCLMVIILCFFCGWIYADLPERNERIRVFVEDYAITETDTVDCAYVYPDMEYFYDIKVHNVSTAVDSLADNTLDSLFLNLYIPFFLEVDDSAFVYQCGESVDTLLPTLKDTLMESQLVYYQFFIEDSLAESDSGIVHFPVQVVDNSAFDYDGDGVPETIEFGISVVAEVWSAIDNVYDSDSDRNILSNKIDLLISGEVQNPEMLTAIEYDDLGDTIIVQYIIANKKEFIPDSILWVNHFSQNLAFDTLYCEDDTLLLFRELADTNFTYGAKGYFVAADSNLALPDSFSFTVYYQIDKQKLKVNEDTLALMAKVYSNTDTLWNNELIPEDNVWLLDLAIPGPPFEPEFTFYRYIAPEDEEDYEDLMTNEISVNVGQKYGLRIASPDRLAYLDSIRIFADGLVADSALFIIDYGENTLRPYNVVQDTILLTHFPDSIAGEPFYPEGHSNENYYMLTLNTIDLFRSTEYQIVGYFHEEMGEQAQAVATITTEAMQKYLYLTKNKFQPAYGTIGKSVGVRYSLETKEHPETVKIDVYNTAGEHVRNLLSEVVALDGEAQIQWNGRNDSDTLVAPGVYIITIQTNSFYDYCKVIVHP